MKYAAQTQVSSDKSRFEIERILMRYGASGFLYGWDDERNRAMISFRIGGKMFKIVVPLPAKNDREFLYTPERGKPRSPQAAEMAWEQATWQRWRALTLWIKAVLEASESGITTLEEALQPFILLPSGETVGEWMKGQIANAYLTGKMPAFLPLPENNSSKL